MLFRSLLLGLGVVAAEFGGQVKRCSLIIRFWSTVDQNGCKRCSRFACRRLITSVGEIPALLGLGGICMVGV